MDQTSQWCLVRRGPELGFVSVFCTRGKNKESAVMRLVELWCPISSWYPRATVNSRRVQHGLWGSHRPLDPYFLICQQCLSSKIIVKIN